MKNYIFLNSTIANIGGAEVYISHKCDHLKTLGYKKTIEFYDVSCHPDSIISLAVKVAICILGVKRYYMLLSKWQRKRG